MKGWALAAVCVLMSLEAYVEAGCNSCGCNRCCKVCKLVPEVTKVTTYEYFCECEDFCIPGPSRCVGYKQVCDCNGSHCEKVMQPTCGRISTKPKLLKVPVVKEQCGWKCIVVSTCGGCQRSCAQAREATDEETQLAIETARQQGILLTSAEEPIVVTIPEELPAVPEAKPVAAPSKLKAFLGLLGN